MPSEIPDSVKTKMIGGDTVQFTYTNPYLEDRIVGSVQRHRASASVMTYYVFRASETGDEPTDELLLGWAFRTFEKAEKPAAEKEKSANIDQDNPMNLDLSLLPKKAEYVPADKVADLPWDDARRNWWDRFCAVYPDDTSMEGLAEHLTSLGWSVNYDGGWIHPDHPNPMRRLSDWNIVGAWQKAGEPDVRKIRKQHEHPV